MVAPAKAPPSLLAEAKKDCTGRNVKSEREELLGRSRGFIWPDGLVGGRAEPGTPGYTVSPYGSYGG
jgi:hypothetical protein